MSLARMSKFQNSSTLQEFFDSLTKLHFFAASIDTDNEKAVILATDNVQEDLNNININSIPYSLGFDMYAFRKYAMILKYLFLFLSVLHC